MLDPNLIGIGALIGLIAWWVSSVRARERAVDLARRFCSLNEWQLLDQTVSLKSAWPCQTSNGWRLLRRYSFEFSQDGGNRHRAILKMLDGQAQEIITDPHLKP